MGEGSGVAVSCGVGFRLGSDLMLLWLWCRRAATAPVGPLAWEHPHAVGSGPRKGKNTKKKKKEVFKFWFQTDYENLSIPIVILRTTNKIYAKRYNKMHNRMVKMAY